jgi:hypothetical protein
MARLAGATAIWYKGSMAPTAPRRTRLAVDLPADVRRRAKVAAARRDVTLQQYVRGALERQLAEDAPSSLHAADDPVLSELWDNDADAVYDDM